MLFENIPKVLHYSKTVRQSLSILSGNNTFRSRLIASSVYPVGMKCQLLSALRYMSP